MPPRLTALLFTLTALCFGTASAAPIDLTGIDDTAIYAFDGTSMTSVNDSDLDTSLTYRTASFWFNTGDVDTQQMIYEEGGRYNGLNIFLDAGSVTVGAWANSAGVWLSNATAANEWHNVAYVFDEGSFSLYYDGGLAKTQSLSFSTIPSHTGHNGLGGNNGWSLIADGTDGQVNASWYYSGLIGGITFNDQAFTADEIADLSATTNPVPIPSGIWLMTSGLFGATIAARRQRFLNR